MTEADKSVIYFWIELNEKPDFAFHKAHQDLSRFNIHREKVIKFVDFESYKALEAKIAKLEKALEKSKKSYMLALETLERNELLLKNAKENIYRFYSEELDEILNQQT